jgi:glycosyltransferase involved in cell wall biosynthesis
VVHLSTVHRLSDPRIRLKECRTLSDAGAQVRLIARSSPIEIKDDIDAVALPEIRSRFDRIVTSQRAALQLVREFEPDVVHFHDPELLVLAPLLRRIAPAVVYDVHESLPDLVLDREWIPRWGRKGVGAICRYLEPLLARACSAYVFVDARWAPRFAPRPWAEVANPPLADEFESVERSSPPVQPHFIYVGELLPERGVHGAVRAVNALDGEPRLTLAGPVADGLADELRALDTHGRLSLPGLVDRTTVHELLTGATAGLVLLEPVPAYDDATATKLFEYLSAGLPMIVSSTTAHRRFADEYGCAVVTDYDDDRQLGVTRVVPEGRR